MAHPDQLGWYIDFLIGNIVFASVIMYGGRWTMLFGVMVAFQRILEIIAVQVWGTYFTGITRRLMDDLLSNTVEEAIAYGQTLYVEIIIGSIIILMYLYIYYYLCKIMLVRIEHKRRNNRLWVKGIRFSFVALLLVLAWNKKAQTDIFFFETENDKKLSYFLSDNTYPYLSRPNKEKDKVDVYFIIGESVSKSHLSLYGYSRKTTPYLDSLLEESLSVWEDPIAPEGHTSASFKAMFSRELYKDDAVFFLSPNLVEELNHSGYKTVWTTYGKMNKRAYVFPALMKKADVFLNASNADDDRVLIDLVSKNLQAEASVYFIDTFGSHGHYKERVSKEQQHFMNEKTDDYKQEIINAYDDTILIMDDIVKRTHEMAVQHSKKTGRKFVVWYVSDHGQNLYADGSDWMGHPASIEKHPNGYKVPFFMINQDSLPCKNTLPPLKEKSVNLGRTFDFMLGGLCLLQDK